MTSRAVPGAGSSAHALGGSARDGYGKTIPALTGEEQRERERSNRDELKTDFWYSNHQMALPTGPTSYFGRRPALTRPLKRAFRNGVPYELRPKLWPAVSGAAYMQARFPEGYYASLTRGPAASALLPLVRAQIAAGSRQFPTHPLLGTGAACDALRRVLTAYAVQNPAAGYSIPCLSQVAGFLLSVYSIQGEEMVFWTLAALVERILHPELHTAGQEGLHVELHVLRDLVKSKLPRLSGALDRVGEPLMALCGDWFSTLFVCALPWDSVARVFDTLLSEGAKVLFRYALALLKQHEEAVCVAMTAHHAAQVLAGRVARTHDRTKLAHVAFYGVGRVARADLNRRRQHYAPRVGEDPAVKANKLSRVLQSSQQLNIDMAGADIAPKATATGDPPEPPTAAVSTKADGDGNAGPGMEPPAGAVATAVASGSAHGPAPGASAAAAVVASGSAHGSGQNATSASAHLPPRRDRSLPAAPPAREVRDNKGTLLRSTPQGGASRSHIVVVGQTRPASPLHAASAHSSGGAGHHAATSGTRPAHPSRLGAAPLDAATAEDHGRHRRAHHHRQGSAAVIGHDNHPRDRRPGAPAMVRARSSADVLGVKPRARPPAHASTAGGSTEGSAPGAAMASLPAGS